MRPTPQPADTTRPGAGGRLLYDAQFAGLGGPLPAWDDLDPEARDGWDQIAVTAGVAVSVLGGHAREVLARSRADRDWFRSAVTAVEAAGGTVTTGGRPVVSWRTDAVLAPDGVSGGFAWPEEWTDTTWLDTQLEDWYDHDGHPQGWPPGIPKPPPPPFPVHPPLELPGVPDYLAIVLGEVTADWALRWDADDPEHQAGVATLAGWTVEQVAAAAASWYAMPGDAFMALGDVPAGPR